MNELLVSISRYSNGMEIAQTIVAMIGVALSFWALLDAVKDGMALRAAGANGARAVIANGNIWTEVERLLKNAICFLVGFMSVFLPPPMFPHQPVPPEELLQHTLTRIGLILITVLLSFGSLRTRHERRLFVRKMGLFKFPPSALAPPPGRFDAAQLYNEQDPRLQRKDAAENPDPEPRKGEA